MNHIQFRIVDFIGGVLIIFEQCFDYVKNVKPPLKILSTEGVIKTHAWSLTLIKYLIMLFQSWSICVIICKWIVSLTLIGKFEIVFESANYLLSSIVALVLIVRTYARRRKVWCLELLITRLCLSLDFINYCRYSSLKLFWKGTWKAFSS